MKREFSYLDKDGQYFPVVEVTLRQAKQVITVKALIDSGASFSVFHPEIAEYLGIKMEQGKKVYLTGIGGRILGYLHKVILDLDGKTFECKLVFSPEFKVSFKIFQP